MLRSVLVVARLVRSLLLLDERSRAVSRGKGVGKGAAVPGLAANGLKLRAGVPANAHRGWAEGLGHRCPGRSKWARDRGDRAQARGRRGHPSVQDAGLAHAPVFRPRRSTVAAEPAIPSVTTTPGRGLVHAPRPAAQACELVATGSGLRWRQGQPVGDDATPVDDRSVPGPVHHRCGRRLPVQDHK